MNRLKQANLWVALVTNVAVAAGLVFLIIEISQNTIALENQIDVAVYADAPIVLLAEHPDLAELEFRLRQRGSKQLTAENMVFPQRLPSRDSFRAFWRKVESSGVLDPEFVTFFNTYMMRFRN